MATRLLPARIESERLVMRLWHVDDAQRLVDAVGANLDHLRPWMPWIAFEPLSAEQRREWIAGVDRAWEAGGDAVYGMFLRSSGEIVGGTGLHRRGEPDELEIGYWLGSAATGLGLATESTAALTSAAFEHPGITRAIVRHDRANVRSAAVPTRLGFARVGEDPRSPEAPGEEGVAVTWAISSREWDTLGARWRGTMGEWHSSPSSTDPT